MYTSYKPDCWTDFTIGHVVLGARDKQIIYNTASVVNPKRCKYDSL